MLPKGHWYLVERKACGSGVAGCAYFQYMTPLFNCSTTRFSGCEMLMAQQPHRLPARGRVARWAAYPLVSFLATLNPYILLWGSVGY